MAGARAVHNGLPKPSHICKTACPASSLRYACRIPGGGAFRGEGAINPETVRLFVPFSGEAPWIVRGGASRVGTYPTRAEAISAAVRVRAKLARAWGLQHPPVHVQESDGSWHELVDSDSSTLLQ